MGWKVEEACVRVLARIGMERRREKQRLTRVRLSTWPLFLLLFRRVEEDRVRRIKINFMMKIRTVGSA